MTKKFSVTVGYTTYMLDPGDVAELLAISSRAVRIERQKYSEPFHPAVEQEPFITSVELVDVEDGPIADAPDKMTAATREASDLPF